VPCRPNFVTFWNLSYEELEELNLRAKEQRRNRVAADVIQEERLKYLADTPGIKAVTVLFSDLEGRLHMLDYDKKFLVKSYDNLTFDGSSIRGFTAQRESDLRLALRLERVLLDAGRRVRLGQGAGVRRSDRQERRTLFRRYSRRSEDFAGSSLTRTATR
jgi:hypothetical protein